MIPAEERVLPDLHQQGAEGPGERPETVEEFGAILVFPEDDLAVQPAAHQVLERTGGIKTGTARRDGWQELHKGYCCNVLYYRPLFVFRI
jgi:hypothetical protein